MKRTLLFMLLSLMVLTAAAQKAARDGVEVLYFHGKQRCATCMAIEKYAREVVQQDFAAEAKSGKVRFRVVDITTPEGAKEAKAYKVTWSSLYVNRWKGGHAERHDLTQFGFRHARKHTAQYKAELKKKIKALLK